MFIENTVVTVLSVVISDTIDIVVVVDVVDTVVIVDVVDTVVIVVGIRCNNVVE